MLLLTPPPVLLFKLSNAPAGHYTGLDRIWQDAFSDYLIDSCLSDQFQWDLNPDSGDTGGLFKVRQPLDATTLNEPLNTSRSVNHVWDEDMSRLVGLFKAHDTSGLPHSITTM